MSTIHIKQKLSELEASLRQEIGALPQLSEIRGAQSAKLSLGDLIDLMAQSHLLDHPLFCRLSRLDAAICQLDLGLYGLCADCETEIDPIRLQQDPTEQRCSSCAEHYQHEHRHELRLSH